MKQIRILVMFAVLCMILPLASYAQHHRHPRNAEINVTNDTNTQVTVAITTERYGREQWTFEPGRDIYLSRNGGIKLRLTGNDEIEIADWGKFYIQDVAEFRNGVWSLSIRHARRQARQQSSR